MNAPSQYGPTTLPLVAPATGEAVTDPLLTVLLSFFSAVGNAYAPLAWNAVAPNVPVIRSTFAHDPTLEDFNTRSLPALFMWRDEEPTSRIDVAEDIRVSTGTCTLLWVPPPETQGKRATREPFAKGLFDVFDACLEACIDPAWKVPGDTYPTAQSVAVNGSVLFHFLPAIWRLYMGRGRRTTVDVASESGVVTKYGAWSSVLTVQEELVRGGSGQFGTGLQATVNIGPTTPGGSDGYPIAPRNEP